MEKVIIAFAFMLFAARSGWCEAATPPLVVDFYNGKCSDIDVEATVGSLIASLYEQDPAIAAALLRLQFHDCFVHVSRNLRKDQIILHKHA
ncbi:peroxidase 60-like [Dorcoceras hygrometricum]|uniref:Peroxidase 60-like n=1 Tax=Dorcoceras hygrometricum TaxID=472368 RepID=A0A2Z7CP81_9LAMI|nr:peroxidase 60-like [Dorcoceras hygrometricum]